MLGVAIFTGIVLVISIILTVVIHYISQIDNK